MMHKSSFLPAEQIEPRDAIKNSQMDRLHWTLESKQPPGSHKPLAHEGVGIYEPINCDPETSRTSRASADVTERTTLSGLDLFVCLGKDTHCAST